MESLAKPSRTLPKPRSPIPRVSRRPKKKKRSKGKRASRKALLKQADILWSKIVKVGGVCVLQRWSPHECRGPLQAMHGIPRTYRATRWELSNGFPGCAAIHLRYTWKAEEWCALLLTIWGQSLFEMLWAQAREMGKPDAQAILAVLSAEAERLGVSV